MLFNTGMLEAGERRKGMKYCIEVEHLKKQFGTLEAVKDLSFKVEQGELFGFLGINGAGKSTTINMLCTLLKPTSGTVKVAGYDLERENKEIRKKIGVVFQGNTLDEQLTVYENLVARANLYEKESRVVKSRIAQVAKVLDLIELYDRPFKALSGGQKRKCEIARALLNQPEILFLDEPTTGLDPKTRKMVWENIDQLRQETGMTVFLTTHYMEEVSKAQHVAVMDAGQMIAYDTPYGLKEMYAKDLIRVDSKEKEQIRAILLAEHLNYKEEDNRIQIEVPSSIEALPILEKLKKYIEAFEVVQGTMEDAFLNMTGKSLQEV